MKIVENTLWCALITLALAATATAVEKKEPGKDKVNRLREIKVELGLQATYDTNLLQSTADKADRYFTRILGLELKHGTPQGSDFGFQGELRKKKYVKFKDQDDTEYEANPFANLRMGGVAKLNLTGIFSNSITPIDSTNVTRVETDTQGGGAVLTITPSSLFGVEITGEIEDKTYDKNAFESLDYRKQTAGFSAYLHSTKKSRIGMRYLWLNNDYVKTERHDYTGNRGTGFWIFDATGKLTSRLEAGIQNLNYDEGYAMVTDTDDVENGFYALWDLIYNQSDKWQLTAGVLRDVHNSSAADSNFYSETGARVGATFKATKALAFAAGTNYKDIDENGATDSETAGLTAGVTYRFAHYFQATLDYEFKDHNSDVSTGDYDRHMTSAGVFVRF